MGEAIPREVGARLRMSENGAYAVICRRGCPFHRDVVRLMCPA
jgi:hypothetical protein